MVRQSKIISYAYKVVRTMAARLYYLRYDLENLEIYKTKGHALPAHCPVDSRYLRGVRQRWLSWSASSILSRSEFELYCYFSNKKDLDFMPSNVWFTTIDPILNDKQTALAYAEKGNYRKLYGIDNEPFSFFRYLNGLSFDFEGNLITQPHNYFEEQIKKQKKVLVKPVIESWGGRNILVFEKNQSDEWTCLNDKVSLSFKGLIAYYKKNFVVQEYLDQHPFYKQFNPSSFNTLRLYVYRSPTDERAHVLHSLLKVGKPGNLVDNISSGGSFYYLNPDGTFLFGISSDLKKLEYLPQQPGGALKKLEKAPGLEKVYDLAKKIALNIPFHRLIAFDMNIDVSGNPRLIELNLSEAGQGVQLFGLPFFGPFTGEVIEYCKSHKKVDFLKI